jgi:hypothetical protein
MKRKANKREREREETIARTPPAMLQRIRDILGKFDRLMSSLEWSRASAEDRARVGEIRDLALQAEYAIAVHYTGLLTMVQALPMFLGDLGLPALAPPALPRRCERR